MVLKKIIIAIDGHSSTGKSTTAKVVAQKLHYVYVDTGAMYRAVTLYAIENNLIENGEVNTKSLLKQLENIRLSFVYNDSLGYAEIYLNHRNVENEIRSLTVSQSVSKIAQLPEVRQKLVSLQQHMGKEKGIVMDGRDIGTVVFPDAELKIFMTASAEIRAKRRFDELQAKGENVTFDEVLENVKNRDFIDSTRKESPLKKADDAIVIDNSKLTVDQQIQKIITLAEKLIS